MKHSIRLIVALALIVSTLTGFTATSASTFGDWEYEDDGTAITITEYTGSATTVTIPATIYGKPVTVIGDSAFSACGNLASITIPSSVAYIGHHAFNYCISLTSITIPESVTSIGEHVFHDWQHDILKELTIIGKAGSYADVYARAKGIPFEIDTPSAWAKEEVEAAIAAGLVPENLQMNYKRTVTRGEVAQIFINLIEKATNQDIDSIMAEKGVAIDENAFTDTTDHAVLAANALGIIKGVGDNKFDPNGIITRAQIAVIINRVARTLGEDTEGYTHSFTDAMGHWVSAELGWPVHSEIIQGVGGNKFNPDGNLTTEMVIAITYRALTALSE